ncbi:MAG: hypothetical protein HFJ50_02435 [Clostridia bacterium]|nr:hypothetical protein [Clostridia bacterium]
MRLQKCKNGLVVLAENQTKGKGTNGRNWYTSKKENLTFSFFLSPKCNISNLKNLTLIISETIVSVIKELYGFSLEIKYPNDIVKNGKKLRRNTYRELHKRRNNRKYNNSG